MKRHIIHIHGRDPKSWFPPEGTDSWYLSGWSGVIAQHTVKYTDRYEVENWRADSSVSEVLTRRVSGVTCRVFPARGAGDLKTGPPAMWDYLRTLCDRGSVIVHHSGIHLSGFYWLLRHFGDIPIIGQHHGDARPFSTHNQRTPVSRIAQWINESVLLPRAAHFLYLRRSEARYLSKVASNVPNTFLTVGTEFDRPLQDAMSRADARRHLGFDPSIPLVLYVGRFFRQKSVEHILTARRGIANRSPASFCLVGGSDRDDLFGEVTMSGVHWRGFLPHAEVLLYYRAADVYLSPFFIYEGFDVSVMEALSFGVPVVSRLLSELPAEDQAHLGRAVSEPNELVPAVTETLDHPKRFTEARAIAQRWFGWETITSRLVQVYDGISAD